MKNILFFTDTPLFGGAEQQMFLLAQFINREKYRIHLACLSAPHLNNLCQKFLDEGLPVHRIPYRHKHDPRALPVLWQLMKEKNIDLVHLHLWNPASCRFGFLAAKLAQKPVIITEHDPFEISKLKQWMKKIFMGNPRGVIAISRANALFLKNQYEKITDKIYLIPNGIDVDSWQANGGSAKKEKFVITNVATLHERKGQDILIQAFARIHSQYPDVKLWLVGEGPWRERYELLAKNLHLQDSVEFLGQRRDIHDILSQTSIFVYPSRREALGMALLEAGMMKLPVIATNVGGIPDIIENGKTGLLVEKKNPEKLAEAIERLLKDDTLKGAGRFMNTLGENLFEKVKRDFSARHMAQETEEVYDAIL